MAVGLDESCVCFCLLCFFALAAWAQTASQTSIPEIVNVSSGTLDLKGYLWKPVGAGPFPAELFNHGSGAEDGQHSAGQTPRLKVLTSFSDQYVCTKCTNVRNATPVGPFANHGLASSFQAVPAMSR